MTAPVAKADANASRAFFVQMLTRDIALEDCILDLLDNSVDGAWRSIGHTAPGLQDGADLSAFRIDIEATPTKFSMSDNCGGMTQERAEKYAFTFGRQEAAPEEEGDYRIGVYGIGMKRALFKLGREIEIVSTFADKSGVLQGFKVPISVPKWMSDRSTDWKFEVYASPPSGKAGLAITVLDLTPGTSNAFGNPATIQNLKRVISRDYALHLHRGLAVYLNGDKIEAWQITLLQGSDFEPQYKTWDVDVLGKKVTVELLAGGAAPPPDDEAPDEDDKGEERFGWYVACNGRIVLAGDKGATSIWGLDGFPIWHRQYRGFLGIIMFTSEDTELLPLTTTKRSVDLSSDVYRGARPAMREVTRKWIDYTNARKSARDAAKAAEAAAKPVSIFNIPQRATISTPTLPARPKIRTSSIQYSMPVSKIRSLAAEFGIVNMPATQVGARSFEYAYDDLVGED